jgi:hypothetical protein
METFEIYAKLLVDGVPTCYSKSLSAEAIEKANNEYTFTFTTSQESQFKQFRNAIRAMSIKEEFYSFKITTAKIPKWFSVTGINIFEDELIYTFGIYNEEEVINTDRCLEPS